MSDKWTQLTKCPQERFSNIVFISPDEFVIAPYNYSKQKSDGLLKYNTSSNKWSLFIKYPKDFQTSNCSLSFDERERKLYLLGAESIIYVINLENNKITELQDGELEVGVNPCSLFVGGELHIVGGSRNRKHIIRNIYNDNEDDTSSEDEKSNKFDEIFEFEDWVKGNQNCGLIYVRSKNEFILFGGYNQYCSPNKYSDMVWVYNLNENKKHRKWVKKCKMPERACYFGYVLSSDERYIVLLGGYTTERKVVKKIYVLDVESFKFIKSPNISSPASGSVRAVMGEDNNIYIFKHDNGSQWRINVQSIINQYGSNDDNYAYQLVKKYKKLLKEAEMENRQIKIQLNKQKQVNEQLNTRKNKTGKGGKNDDVINKKMKKKVSDLEQQIQEQQTEIRRLEEKVSKQGHYINDLESEKMRANNTNLQQRLKIKELQSRLYELEGDSAELQNIEDFLKHQEKITKKQEKAMHAVGVDTPITQD